MKKAKLVLATFLTFVFGVLCLAACGAETGMAGKYYFVSVQMETGGEVKEYGIGDTLPSGIVAKRDSCTFRLKSNGSVDIVLRAGDYNETMSGVWETVEGETNKIIITIDDDPLTCECDGSALIVSLPGEPFVATFKK